MPTTTIRPAVQLLPMLASLILAPQAFAKLTPNLGFSLSPAGGVTHGDGTAVTALIVVRPASSGDPMPSGTIKVYYRDPINTNIEYCSLTIDTSTQVQTCSLDNASFLPAGTPRIIIGYSGDANYDGNDTGAYGEIDYPIAMGTLSWTVTPPALVFPRQPASFYVNVANPGDATGVLKIALGGGYACEVGPKDNYCTMTTPGVDSYPATLTYAGDANYNPIAATEVGPLVVTPFPATMTLSATPASVHVGEEATVTANIVASDVFAVTVSGGVTVTADNVYVCSMSVPNLSCPYRPTSAGTKTLVAHFDSAYLAAPDATTPLSVTEASVDGVCGGDNGKTLGAAPTNLCSAGLASAISGNGPWTWTCAGIDGGNDASCSAQKDGATTTTSAVTSAPALDERLLAPLAALLAFAGAGFARTRRRVR